MSNIEYNDSDSLYFNFEIRKTETDTIISVEGGSREHYSYIGPKLPPPPLPVFEDGDVLTIDSIASFEIKELEYLGTYHYGKVIVSIFYEKGFNQSWLDSLFDGVPLENRKNLIIKFLSRYFRYN